jgi:hypothetical protein
LYPSPNIIRIVKLKGGEIGGVYSTNGSVMNAYRFMVGIKERCTTRKSET